MVSQGLDVAMFRATEARGLTSAIRTPQRRADAAMTIRTPQRRTGAAKMLLMGTAEDDTTRIALSVLDEIEMLLPQGGGAVSERDADTLRELVECVHTLIDPESNPEEKERARDSAKCGGTPEAENGWMVGPTRAQGRSRHGLGADQVSPGWRWRSSRPSWSTRANRPRPASTCTTNGTR